jgi:hypothetical protein
VGTLPIMARPPTTGTSPIRHVRVPEHLWQAAKEKAAALGESVGAVVNRGLREYVAEPEQRTPKRKAPVKRAKPDAPAFTSPTQPDEAQASRPARPVAQPEWKPYPKTAQVKKPKR